MCGVRDICELVGAEIGNLVEVILVGFASDNINYFVKWGLRVSFLVQFDVVAYNAVIGNLLELHIGTHLAGYEIRLECLVKLTLHADLMQTGSVLQIISSRPSNVLC